MGISAALDPAHQGFLTSRRWSLYLHENKTLVSEILLWPLCKGYGSLTPSLSQENPRSTFLCIVSVCVKCTLRITSGFFFVCLFFKEFHFIYLFIYLLIGCVGSSFLCEGFLQLRQAGATLHRGARASHYRSLSLRSTGSRRASSVVVAHGPSCSAACGILPDQGSNPCPLHWQADSQPLRHQGSPHKWVFISYFSLATYEVWSIL